MEYNIYCDESCHLERDRQPAMVLGAIWCPSEAVRTASRRMKELKVRHGLSPYAELKWTKISPSKLGLYVDLVDYFFDNAELHFRGLVAPKLQLNHSAYEQDHDTWYYKMYFDLLKVVLTPAMRYRIYIDIKDTQSNLKTQMLREVLSNNLYDFQRNIVRSIQSVRSHEAQLVQIADVISGAIAYRTRDLESSNSKLKVVNRIQTRSGYSLTHSTLLREDKFNLFVWQPKGT